MIFIDIRLDCSGIRSLGDVPRIRSFVGNGGRGLPAVLTCDVAGVNQLAGVATPEVLELGVDALAVCFRCISGRSEGPGGAAEEMPAVCWRTTAGGEVSGWVGISCRASCCSLPVCKQLDSAFSGECGAAWAEERASGSGFFARSSVTWSVVGLVGCGSIVGYRRRAAEAFREAACRDYLMETFQK